MVEEESIIPQNNNSSQIMTEQRKRNIAFKLRIGDILKSKPIIQEAKLIHIELGDKNIVRVNLIANIVDKYVSMGDKKYATLTLDDASGQIRIKSFGEDTGIVENLSQGDTVQVIGIVREYNSELYITPEVVKPIDPKWLLVRKLEIQNQRKDLPLRANAPLRDLLLDKIKSSEKDQGIDVDAIIMEVEASPNLINQEITKLLEEGLVYEPRPGRLRYLG